MHSHLRKSVHGSQGAAFDFGVIVLRDTQESLSHVRYRDVDAIFNLISYIPLDPPSYLTGFSHSPLSKS